MTKSKKIGVKNVDIYIQIFGGRSVAFAASFLDNIAVHFFQEVMAVLLVIFLKVFSSYVTDIHSSLLRWTIFRNYLHEQNLQCLI